MEEGNSTAVFPRISKNIIHGLGARHRSNVGNTAGISWNFHLILPVDLLFWE